MKKLITVCLIIASSFLVKAQENLTQLKSDVIDELSKGAKVYTPKGNYNRIYDFKYYQIVCYKLINLLSL